MSDERPTTIAGLYEWAYGQLADLNERIIALQAAATAQPLGSAETSALEVTLDTRLGLLERSVFGTDHAAELAALGAAEQTALADARSRRMVDG